MTTPKEVSTSTCTVIRQRFAVRFEYPVYFTEDCLHPDNATLVDALSAAEPARKHRVFFAVDAGFLAAWPDIEARLTAYVEAHAARMVVSGEVHRVPAGEAAKNDPQVIVGLQEALARVGLDRQSFVVALGGGAVLDAVGYAAATVHRGVRLIRIPTTVLAQNDAGIGVKNGINAFGSKNFLGTFAPPFAVINDAQFLRTLAPRDARAGMAEAVKVALIRDAGFYTWLQDKRAELAVFAPNVLSELVHRAAAIHLDHIASAGDPFERGSARPLDFGHWAAHKLERLSDFGLRHGEAVAIGMALDSHISFQNGWITEGLVLDICALLRTLGFALWHDGLAAVDGDGNSQLLNGLAEFREHMGGELNVPMLAGVGLVRETHAIDPDAVRAAVAFLATQRVA